MNTVDLLRDVASRPKSLTAALRGALTPDLLAAHPGGHDNSPSWLLWHSGRVIDMQLSALTGKEEVWTAQGFRERLDLGELGDTMGYGHTPEQARAIISADGEALLDYLDATLDALDADVQAASPSDLEDIVDKSWNPPVTRAARLVSIVLDVMQHLAQVAYIQGMKQRD